LGAGVDRIGEWLDPNWRRVALGGLLEQRQRPPFQVEVHLIFAHDGKAKAHVEAQRAGIEPEDEAADWQPGVRGFLLQALDQHSSDPLALELWVDGDID